jgi:hypothetical protein
VKQDRYERIMLELAELDKKLFTKARDTYDAIKEMAHVRSSLIEIIEDTKREKLEGYFESFLLYARDELSTVYKSMNAFYISIKGKPLETHRLR